MDLSAFAKDPSLLLRRGLAALTSHTMRLGETTLLQKNCAVLKSGRSMLPPYVLYYGKRPCFPPASGFSRTHFSYDAPWRDNAITKNCAVVKSGRSMLRPYGLYYDIGVVVRCFFYSAGGGANTSRVPVFSIELTTPAASIASTMRAARL